MLAKIAPKKPVIAPKPVTAKAPEATNTTPAIVASPAQIPPEIAKRLADLEKALKAEQEKNVLLQEKIAKRSEDKNAWQEKIHTLDQIEQWADVKGDGPIATDDWRLVHHKEYRWLYPFMTNEKDNAIIPQTHLPPMLCLCVVPSTPLPVFPGESPAQNREARRTGMVSFFDDPAYDDAGEICGMRGAPHRVHGADFLRLLVEGQDEQSVATSEETNAEPEIPAEKPAAPVKIKKAK